MNKISLQGGGGDAGAGRRGGAGAVAAAGGGSGAGAGGRGGAGAAAGGGSGAGGGGVIWCSRVTGVRQGAERKPRFKRGWLTLLSTCRIQHVPTHTHTHVLTRTHTHTHVESTLWVVPLNTSCSVAKLWKGKLNFTGTKPPDSPAVFRKIKKKKKKAASLCESKAFLKPPSLHAPRPLPPSFLSSFPPSSSTSPPSLLHCRGIKVWDALLNTLFMKDLCRRGLTIVCKQRMQKKICKMLLTFSTSLLLFLPLSFSPLLTQWLFKHLFFIVLAAENFLLSVYASIKSTSSHAKPGVNTNSLAVLLFCLHN